MAWARKQDPLSKVAGPKSAFKGIAIYWWTVNKIFLKSHVKYYWKCLNALLFATVVPSLHVYVCIILNYVRM
jgi:hypothetical protein